jgi:hypothetical protein
MRPGGRGRFGKLGCATHVCELTAAQLLAQFRELVVLLVLSVIEDGVAKFRQLPGELVAVDVELLQLLENCVGFMLFVQSLLDHRVPVGDLSLGPGVGGRLEGDPRRDVSAR